MGYIRIMAAIANSELNPATLLKEFSGYLLGIIAVFFRSCRGLAAIYLDSSVFSTIDEYKQSLQKVVAPPLSSLER